jgi:hypothetical protein
MLVQHGTVTVTEGVKDDKDKQYGVAASAAAAAGC